MKIKIKEGFLLRKVAGDHVVVPVGEAGKVFHGMIRLNDTGAFLWEQCRKETTKEQVLQAMAEKGTPAGMIFTIQSPSIPHITEGRL